METPIDLVPRRRVNRGVEKVTIPSPPRKASRERLLTDFKPKLTHIINSQTCVKRPYKTSSPKGNDAHLRAIIQTKKKWKHQFFRRVRAANSVVHGRIWPNFKLIQALMYVIITCKYEKDHIKNNREKVAKPFYKL